MPPESAAYLWDVRAAGDRVASFTAGMTLLGLCLPQAERGQTYDR